MLPSVFALCWRDMPHVDDPGSPAHSDRRSLAAVCAAVIVALQGVGLLVAGIYLIVRAREPAAGHRGSTEVLGVLSVLAGVGVLALARALRARQRRMRSPVLVLEIICLPIALTTVQGGRWYVGLPLGVAALGVIILMGVAGLLVPRDD
jgi:hypothetical protein